MSRLSCLTVVALWSSLPHAAPCASPADAPDSSAALVRRALAAEIDGSPAERSRWLQRALERDPSSQAARWHSGFVADQKGWRHVSEPTVPAAASERLEEYLALREQTANTAAGHVELADWSRRHQDRQRERAHLTAALELSGNPNDPSLRARLGHQLIDGIWVGREELREREELARRLRDDFLRWLPRIQRINRQLDHSRRETRERALEQLEAIRDPAALLAMEAVLATGELQRARSYVEVLDKMTTHRAAEFLARQAALSPYKRVRQEAAEKLRSRPHESYAPFLLPALSTPIESRMTLYAGPSGVHLSQAFFRETQEYRQLATIDSDTWFQHFVVRGTGLARTDGGRAVRYWNAQAQSRAVSQAVVDRRLKAHAAQRSVTLTNDVIQKCNDRVLAALAIATGLHLAADPQPWWQWWLDYNQLCLEGEKPCQYFCMTEEFIEPVEMIMPMSCLVAGTPVWTERGPVSVEQLQVGDLVLAKHPETGELAYKPVLRTTVRPETTLLKVTAGGSSFEATEGHTFWISGSGWKKLREVAPGMRFHGAVGPVPIETLTKAEPQPTYNLVVADFHTYFVGDAMILSHDPTFARPTDFPVPGLLTENHLTAAATAESP